MKTTKYTSNQMEIAYAWTHAKTIGSHDQIGTVAIITGEYELLLRVKAMSMNDYFDMLKDVMNDNPIRDVKTISCLDVVKHSGVTHPIRSN